MLDEVYKKSQSIMYIGDKENSNTDSALVSTKRSLIFNELNKDGNEFYFNILPGYDGNKIKLTGTGMNGISIEKNADSTWNLLLQIATDDGLGSVTYTSDDEWKTWNRKEK